MIEQFDLKHIDFIYEAVDVDCDKYKWVGTQLISVLLSQ
jgi:hypothetical protein